MDNLPQDPIILFSFVNTRLRDNYPDLDALCEDLHVDREALEARLSAAGFQYLPEQNQFR